MIGVLALVPFVLLPVVLDWSAMQASIASLALAIITIVWKKKDIIVSYSSLPWIVWPIFLFALTPVHSELFSEQSLRQYVWLALAVMGWGKVDNEAVARRWLYISALAVFVVQIAGMISGHELLALNSVYAQENVFHFVNLGVMATVLWTLLWGREIPVWKGLSVTILLLIIASLVFGDTYIQGAWGISAGDCIGVWIGLLCGLLISVCVWVLVRVGISQRVLLLIGAMLFIFWIFLPFLVVELPIWHKGMGSSWTSRIDFWRASICLISNHWFMGVGSGQFGATIQDYWPPISDALQHAWSFPIAPHNQFLWVWAETGVVGLLIYGFTWAAPWLGALVKYSQTRDTIWLYWIFILSTFLSVMLVLESAQMFFVGQTVAWLVSLYAMRSQGWLKGYEIKFSTKWFWLLVPLVAMLMWDRGWQIRSRYLSTPTEMNGRVLPEQISNLNAALEKHRKNSPALYYIAELHRLNENYSQALKAVDELQEITGTQWPVHRMRAEIYRDMGNKNEACRNALWPVTHSTQTLDQALRSEIDCGWK